MTRTEQKKLTKGATAHAIRISHRRPRQVNVRLDQEVYSRFAAWCQERGITMPRAGAKLIFDLLK